jgi:phenylpropionate dioxygenase-like ring-hydroxylating dioxygenase large terminal subunit
MRVSDIEDDRLSTSSVDAKVKKRRISMPKTQITPPTGFIPDSDVVDRVLGHVAAGTTDRGTETWREPTDHYRSEDRLAAELEFFKSVPTAFCPSTALVKPGDYIARTAAGTPLIVVRGHDKTVRAFKNACRHRGAELAEGKGCAGAFVCPYHGWSYGLDGALLGIPHEDGFPDINKLEQGLVEVTAIETKGIIFVCQNESGLNAAEMLTGVPDALAPDQIIFAENELIVEANWKLHLESFLEGYHIKPTHKETFYPFGYDNLNVIEFCGPHARVTFPFQRITQLADVAPEDRKVSDKLTYLNHLFPNVILAELSHHRTLGILEPLGVSRTKITTYHITKSNPTADKDTLIETAARDLEFVNGTGQTEDIAMVEGIQRSLKTGANDALTFGHFEPAIVHFHQQMAAHLA